MNTAYRKSQGNPDNHTMTAEGEAKAKKKGDRDQEQNEAGVGSGNRAGRVAPRRAKKANSETARIKNVNPAGKHKQEGIGQVSRRPADRITRELQC